MEPDGPSSSSVIDLPAGKPSGPRRMMPSVRVRCPLGHRLRMSAEALSGGRRCFCPRCRTVFVPEADELDRAEARLEIGTRARSPLPPVMAGARSWGRSLVPFAWRTAARRAWRRLLRMFG